MRVKDIMGNNRNVKLEEISMHFESARGLTFWKSKNGKNLRLVLNEDQKELVKNTGEQVEYFNGYRTQLKYLSELENVTA